MRNSILIGLMAGFMVYCFTISAPVALPATKTIVIDEKHPLKSKPIKPDRSTRVITKKGKSSSAKKTATKDDLCTSGLLKGFYCLNMNKEAWESKSNIYLGKITGVAWRKPGETISIYLPPIEADTPDAFGTVKNFTAEKESFYYIIDTSATRVFLAGPLFIETQRVFTE